MLTSSHESLVADRAPAPLTPLEESLVGDAFKAPEGSRFKDRDLLAGVDVYAHMRDHAARGRPAAPVGAKLSMPWLRPMHTSGTYSRSTTFAAGGAASRPPGRSRPPAALRRAAAAAARSSDACGCAFLRGAETVYWAGTRAPTPIARRGHRRRRGQEG